MVKASCHPSLLKGIKEMFLTKARYGNDAFLVSFNIYYLQQKRLEEKQAYLLYLSNISYKLCDKHCIPTHFFTELEVGIQ